MPSFKRSCRAKEREPPPAGSQSQGEAGAKMVRGTIHIPIQATYLHKHTVDLLGKRCINVTVRNQLSSQVATVTSKRRNFAIAPRETSCTLLYLTRHRNWIFWTRRRLQYCRHFLSFVHSLHAASSIVLFHYKQIYSQIGRLRTKRIRLE